jgi:hypothetical protein
MILNENALKKMIRGVIASQYGFLKEGTEANQTGVLSVGDSWWNNYANKICKNDEKYDYKIIMGLTRYLTKNVHMTDASHGIMNLMINTVKKDTVLEGFGPDSNRLLGIIKSVNESASDNKNLKIPAILHILFCNLKSFVKLVIRTPNFYDGDRMFSDRALKSLTSDYKDLGTKIAYDREDKNTYHDFYNNLSSFEGEEIGKDAAQRKVERMQDMKDANNAKSKTEKYSIFTTNPEDRVAGSGLKKYHAAREKEDENDIEGADAIWLSFTDEEIEQLTGTAGEERLKSSIEKAKLRKEEKPERERRLRNFSRSFRGPKF